jgi:hypothetical protein
VKAFSNFAVLCIQIVSICWELFIWLVLIGKLISGKIDFLVENSNRKLNETLYNFQRSLLGALLNRDLKKHNLEKICRVLFQKLTHWAGIYKESPVFYKIWPTVENKAKDML